MPPFAPSAPDLSTLVLVLSSLVAAGFALSAGLTWGARRHALRRGMLDVPNHRSSHEVPTPRGGGVGFVVVVLAGTLALALAVPSARPLAWALLGGGAVAGVGWLDDRVSLPASRRLVLHGLAAVWALAWIGPPTELALGVATVPLGWLGAPLAWLGIVWAINLYNFMDGIDGLAAGQAVIAGAAGALLALALGSVETGLVAALLAAAAGGFLVWNFPPARIFMGDVGSGFLGYAFAVLALHGAAREGPPLLVWVLLLGVFLVDATATLLRRMARSRDWMEAHREHAYQQAVQRGHSHRRVTLVLLGVALGLACAAAVAALVPVLALPLAVLATVALLLGWRRYAQPRRAATGHRRA